MLRMLRPSVRWGLYSVPNALINIPAPAHRRAINDEFGWLIGLTDFLAPSFYRMPYVQYPSMLPGCNSSTGTRLVRWYEENMREARRLRDLYAPGRPIIPYVWVHYHYASPCTDDPDRPPVLSDENIRGMLTLPRRFGADGVFLWHHLDGPYTTRRWMGPDELEYHVYERIVPVLERTRAQPTEQ